MQYLVFDIETLVDWDRAYGVEHHKGEDKQTFIHRYLDDLRKKQEKDDPFVPARYHLPVSAAFIATKADGSYAAHKVIGSLDSGWLTREFWSLIALAPSQLGITTLCTFNGITFDMPVMEVNAHRYAVKMKEWMILHSKYASENPRSRYNESAHLDLFSFLSGPGGAGGGLDYWCQLVGLPGKQDFDGSNVADVLSEHGEQGLALVNDYCLADVLSTYGLLLHLLATAGEIDGEPGPYTWQMDQALETILQSGDVHPDGSVKRWVNAYRASKSGSGVSEDARPG